MHPTVFIFDLYGTLADVHTDESLAALWEGAAEDANARGAAYTSQSYRAAYLRLCADEVQLRAKVEPDVPISYVEPELLHVFERLLSEQGLEAADAPMLARRFRERSTLHLRPFPNTLETLDALHAAGKRVYLLSNAQSCFTVDELRKLDLSDRFDGVLLSSDAGMKKPYRGLFELLLSRYGIDRREAVMVGNDKDADMRGAFKAGLRGAYIHTWQSGDRPAALPAGCFEITDLNELTKLI